ncbi:MAG: hypothetical protein RTU09_04015 [Candidatus Thorarchaeota archaeon]
MSTNFSFRKETIESFEQEHGVSIDLQPNQQDNLGDSGTTSLLLEQIDKLVTEMSRSYDSIFGFIKDHSKAIEPISMTLLVMNEATWKIMEKKPKHADCMLPMVTIPWFHWSGNVVTPRNPEGIQRHDRGTARITGAINGKRIIISGTGGNFCGLLEGRVADPYSEARPLILPGDRGVVGLVPLYEKQDLTVTIDMDGLETTLYSEPDKKVDYTFSESPKTFYNHGLQLKADGAQVHLRVGKGKEYELRGEVKVLLGKHIKEEDDSSTTLLFHVWLSALNRLLLQQ